MTLPARILIVDDEKPVVDLLSLAFEQEGHVVARAADGIDCMNRMAGFRPDVVIMDIMMPRLDGLEATRLIRQGGVRLDDSKVAPDTREIDAKAGESRLVKVGKRRFARVIFS